MRQHSANLTCLLNTLFLFLAWMIVPIGSSEADKLVALYSAHAVPYAMPWVADELGLFKKYDIDFAFVYIPSSSTATSAISGNNVEVVLLGGVGIGNVYVFGIRDLLFFSLFHYTTLFQLGVLAHMMVETSKA